MIRIVAVGRIKEKASKELIDEYVKRIRPYTKLTITEVNEEIIPQSNSDAQNEAAKEAEGKAILKCISDKDYVIALDLHGKSFTSEQMAAKLDELNTYGHSDIVFVIAGSLGYSPEVIQRADMRWKLSDCTFPHQLVRVLVVEQIYRMFKINRHEPYHK